MKTKWKIRSICLKTWKTGSPMVNIKRPWSSHRESSKRAPRPLCSSPSSRLTATWRLESYKIVWISFKNTRLKSLLTLRQPNTSLSSTTVCRDILRPRWYWNMSLICSRIDKTCLNSCSFHMWEKANCLSSKTKPLPFIRRIRRKSTHNGPSRVCTLSVST